MGAAKKARTTELESSLHVVSEALSPKAVVEKLISGDCKHVIQEGSDHFVKELQSARILLQHPNDFFKHTISTVLFPEQASPEEKKNRILSVDFNCSDQKPLILASLEKELAHLVRSGSYRSELITVADEMITNAVYNAPFVDVSNSSSGASRRQKTLKLEPGKTATFFMGADESRLAIGCVDPYGKLNVPKLLERIKNCYDTSVAENINMNGSGGAGIGTYMIFHLSMSSFIGVVPGRATVFCSVFPRQGSNVTRHEKLKNLHLIY